MLLKKHVLVISLLALVQMELKSQDNRADSSSSNKQDKPESLVIFRDTTIEYNGLIFEFKNNYSKRIFFKTTLYIHNPTKNYLALVADCMYVFTKDSEREGVHTSNPFVVAPLHSIRYKMRFDGFKLNRDQIHLAIHKARVSDEKLAVYEPFKISTLPDRPYKIGNLELEVLKVQHGNNGRHVRLQIINKNKNALLGIDFSKIYIKLLDGQKVYNDIEDYHRMHQIREKDLNLLVFRIAKGVKTDKFIYFDEVFSECSMKDLKDFKIDLDLKADYGNPDVSGTDEKDEKEGD
ncbi:MAG: hypothetical protein JNL60_13400 [Bacteroidia bacterium]|nr:hypothetical protein [Bacteroidia bacterium]